jgi:hypothetical protein
MDPTHKGSPTQAGSSPQRSLFENAGRKSDQNDVERGLNTDTRGFNTNLPLQSEPARPLDNDTEGTGRPVLVAPEPFEPLWAQRMKLVIFVFFSVWVGMLLIIFPWTPVWTHNSLLAAYPAAHDILNHYFTRGAVNGLGLVDIWIGIWAAVQYREKK